MTDGWNLSISTTLVILAGGGAAAVRQGVRFWGEVILERERRATMAMVAASAPAGSEFAGRSGADGGTMIRMGGGAGEDGQRASAVPRDEGDEKQQPLPDRRRDYAEQDLDDEVCELYIAHALRMVAYLQRMGLSIHDAAAAAVARECNVYWVRANAVGHAEVDRDFIAAHAEMFAGQASRYEGAMQAIQADQAFLEHLAGQAQRLRT